MFSDIFVQYGVFMYNVAPVVAIVTVLLIVLNEIRKVKVARRKRAVMARRTAEKHAAFNTFDTI